MDNQSTCISEGGSGEGFCSTNMPQVTPFKPTARKRKLVFDDDPSTATRHAQAQAQWSAHNPPAGAGGMVSHNYLGQPARAGATVSHNYFGSPVPRVLSSHNYFSPPPAGEMGSDHININGGSVRWFCPSHTQISNPPPVEEVGAAYVTTPASSVNTPASYVNTPPRVPPPTEEAATAYVNTPPRHASQHEYVGNESSVGLSCFSISEEVYALYRGARANQPSNAGLVRNNVNLTCGHYQHSPSNGNSNALYSCYANRWNNPTYPYLSFLASANDIPVQHLQNTDISNKSQTQTHTLLSLPSTDASLAPVTPEKNIQNERAPVTPEKNIQSERESTLEQKSLSSADVSSEGKVVAHEQQPDPLNLWLPTDLKDTKDHPGQSLSPLIDTSALAFHMSSDHQLASEGQIDGFDFDLNKTPPPKAKRKKHRPKVIREGSSARKSKAKNLQQPTAERNSEGDKILSDNPCISEDTSLDKETLQKLQVNKSVQADQLVDGSPHSARKSKANNLQQPIAEKNSEGDKILSDNPCISEDTSLNKETLQKMQDNKSIQADQLVDGSPHACEEEPTSFSKAPPYAQKEKINQETEKSQGLQQHHIQSQGLQQHHIQSAGPIVTAEPPNLQTTLMSSPQEGNIFMNSNNKSSSTIDNLTESPSIVSSVRRKSARENVKTLARKRDQLVTKEMCINTLAETKAITSQSFTTNDPPTNDPPDKLTKQRRKKRQTRKLTSLPSDSSCKVSTNADFEFRVGDQANTTIAAYQPLCGHNSSYCGMSCSYWGAHMQKMHPLPQNVHWIGFKNSVYERQSSNNLFEPGNSSPSSKASSSLLDVVETMVQRLKDLQIDEKHQDNINQGLEMVPSNGNGELVPYVGNHAMVPYEGPFHPLKKKKPRPRVDLDIETSIAWRVLMGKASDQDKQATADGDRELRWEEERNIFKGRAESFIARMHLVQGDRRFSQWKGSVVDSVVGAFLTQNVSDHLSSSAFISLASRFPPVEKNEGTPCDSNDLGESELEVSTLAYEVSQTEENPAQLLSAQIPEYSPVSPGMDELGEENLNENANSGESHASNLSGDKSNYADNCQKITCNHRHCISADIINECNVWENVQQDQCLSDVNVQMTMANRLTDSTNQCADRFGSSSASNYNTGEQINEDFWNRTESFPEPQSFTQLLKNVENNKLWHLNVTVSSSQTSTYDDTTSTLVQFPLAQYKNREENELGGTNFTALESCGSDWIVNQNSASRAGTSEFSQNQENGGIPNVTIPLLERPQAHTILNLEPEVVGLGKDQTENIPQDKGAHSEDLKHSVAGQNIAGISGESGKLLQVKVKGATQPEEDAMIDFLGRGPEKNCDKVSCTQDSSLTEASINAAATLWSLAQGNSNLNPECLDPPQDQPTEASELAQSSTQEDHQKSGNLGLEIPKFSSKDGKSKAPKIYTRKISGIARANIEMTQKNNKPMIDWETMRAKAPIFHKRERDPDTKDAMNWEAVRCADVEDIAETIRERGMNNILAGRIKAFLEELHKKQGDIDLEWLKDIPPDDSKNFLLSIRGLGLKSVECIRLLALQHLAFPVDTNVGRICVRLGWVPLQPLPESVQLHLLELYPVLESIQKYLWPRLCKLDQRTLYELHYQMITFGKVFCTKSRPNCNACPMRCDCKHFASAFTSARLLLTSTKESSSDTNPMLTLPCKENENAPSTPLPLPTIQQDVNIERPAEVLPLQLLKSNPQDHKCEPIIEEPQDHKCEPIIEEPTTPEPEFIENTNTIVEECAYTDPDEIPVIKLNFDQLALHIQRVYEDNMLDLEDTNSGAISKALVTLSPEAASIPIPKLKNVSRLRTEHRVYELPDDHPLLRRLEAREPDDPCSYLLAIWTPGETSDSTAAAEQCCSTQASNSHPCDQESCNSCANQNIISETTVKGTLLIPCRTAMRGSFPLNGTYFQVNEVFADHETSLNPIEVPRSWIWRLTRRTVYFGTSIPTIFRGLTTEVIQQCFWRGFVCVRGFDRTVRAPRPLVARLHFPASKQIKPRKRQTREKIVKGV